MTAEQLQNRLGTPGLSLEADTRLVLSPKGEVVGTGTVLDLAEPHVQVESAGAVHPAHTGKGIGSAILSWIEERAREAIPKAPPDARVSLHQGADEREKASRALLERHGFRAIRHFWRMVIAMDAPPPTALWPEGIHVRTIDPKADLRRAYLAIRDAFKDHWGFVEGPVEEEFHRLEHRIAHDPDFDPTLFFLAEEAEEIAGVCYARPKTGTDASMGYVQVLGVLRPWRRRGLALALLHHAFGEFYRRGVKKVALHVDAQSLTGATCLYEKAGMTADEVGHAYEKELRPGIELATH
jgi:mycothiol synthase